MKTISIILLCIFTISILADPADSLWVNKEEVIQVFNRVKSLERSDSLKTKQIGVQKLIIESQNNLIFQIKEKSKIDSMRADLYREQAKLNKPSFWEKKELWFIYGFGFMLGSSWVVYNISH